MKGKKQLILAIWPQAGLAHWQSIGHTCVSIGKGTGGLKIH